MVSFQQIQDTIATNVHKFVFMNIRILPPHPVQQFKIPLLAVEETKIPKKVLPVSIVHPLDTKQTQGCPKSDSDSDESLPPPTRCIGSRSLPVQPIEQEIPKDTPKEIPSETPKHRPLPTSNRSIDPICIAVELHDPMYAIASPNVRTSLECSEAQRLESIVDKLYKEQSGRSRGWTKTKLIDFLVPRAAAGGRPRTPFDWSAIWTQKEASALLDFVCLAKGIRLAVWKSEQEVGLWPAADIEGSNPPLFHVSSTGIPIQDRSFSNIQILAPYSVLAGLEKLSLGELESLAEKMNVALPRGKKGEIAGFLASARMRMRLSLA